MEIEQALLRTAVLSSGGCEGLVVSTPDSCKNAEPGHCQACLRLQWFCNWRLRDAACIKGLKVGGLGFRGARAIDLSFTKSLNASTIPRFIPMTAPLLLSSPSILSKKWLTLRGKNRPSWLRHGEKPAGRFCKSPPAVMGQSIGWHLRAGFVMWLRLRRAQGLVILKQSSFPHRSWLPATFVPFVRPSTGLAGNVQGFGKSKIKRHKPWTLNLNRAGSERVRDMRLLERRDRILGNRRAPQLKVWGTMVDRISLLILV